MARTQADFRRDLNPKDQYGRKWQMTIEIATGDPTGGIFPAGWTDPLRTPMKYLRVPRNEDGQAEIGKLRLHFETWIADQEEAEQQWFRQLHLNARDVYKRLDQDQVEHLEDDKFLQDLTGPMPWPKASVLKLAAAGDKALLGMVPLTSRERVMLHLQTMEDIKSGATLKPAELETPATDPLTPPDTYPQFVAWCFKTGGATPGDLKKAAELWAVHRQNLQPAT